MSILDSIVIGAGQAGLSASYHLTRLGIRHVVLDADTQAGGAWRHRWDALTMRDVHGVAELPGDTPPPRDGQRANVAVPDPSSGSSTELPPEVRVTDPPSAPPTVTVPVAPAPYAVVPAESPSTVVVPPFTRVNASAFEVEVLAVAVLSNTAVTAWSPDRNPPGRSRLATPALTGAVPSEVAPSKNSTVPAGEASVTVAVSVTGSPEIFT